MFNRRTVKISVLGVIALFAAMLSVTRSAEAAEVTGEVGLPVIVPHDQAIATIQFLGSSAAHTGQLYFLGSGVDPMTINTFAPNSDDAGLGMFLFNNHHSAIGETITIPNVFSAGEVLHFAYDIIAPSHAANELYRTDIDADQIQFMFDPETGFFGVEDLRLPYSDEDYNDAMFNIAYSSIPGPSVLATMAIALGLTRTRR